MTSQPAIAKVMRHDRMLVVSGLLLVIVLSWVYLLMGAGTMPEIGDMLVPASAHAWTSGYAAVMLVMWAIMMAAMMLPSAAPMILLFATIERGRRARGEQAAAAGRFASGYLVVWTVFSVGATAIQYGLDLAALLSPAMHTTSIVVAGAVLLAAGIYQLTPFKQACLQRCRSPLEFVMAHWRDGNGGAFVMGFQHGLFCLGCCWALMLLLFVGGVMNMQWIAGLTIFVLIEKLAPAGHWLGRGAGILLIGWGAATLVAAG